MKKSNLKTVTIDLPTWFIENLDNEAKKIGISRKALINVLLISSLSKRIKISSMDSDYLQAIQESFAEEWLSREDDEAFHDL